ncbi:hypothetical protein ABVN80_20025 [Acinetobacter baumannii]
MTVVIRTSGVDKAYAHYRKLKIDTKTKMLTFSDGLNLRKGLGATSIFQRPFPGEFRYWY